MKINFRPWLYSKGKVDGVRKCVTFQNSNTEIEIKGESWFRVHKVN